MQFKTSYNNAKPYKPKVNQKEKSTPVTKTESLFITASMANELLILKNRDIFTKEMRKLDVADGKSLQLGRIRKD